jgi:hypothetical protein
MRSTSRCGGGSSRSTPAEPVDPPSIPHNEVRPYSHDEARAFLRAVRGVRLEARRVFATRNGTPVHPRNDYRSFREIIRQTDFGPSGFTIFATRRPASCSPRAYLPEW